MMMLIYGPNGSGKSRYAEGLATRFDGRRSYIATMVSQNEENERRIEKHRRQRAGLGFRTLEIPYKVDEASVDAEELVLLEDLSNLLANRMFTAGGTEEETLEEVLALRRRCRHLLVVSIGDLHEEEYDGETAAYIRSLNRLNARLAEAADTVVELQDGRPHIRKGEVLL